MFQATRVVFLIVASPELWPPPCSSPPTPTFPSRGRPTSTQQMCDERLHCSHRLASHGLHQAPPTSPPSMRTRPKPWWCCSRCLHSLQGGWSHCIPPRSFVHPKFQNRPATRHTCSYPDQGLVIRRLNLLQRSLPEYSISKLSQCCRHRTSQCLKSCRKRIYKRQYLNLFRVESIIRAVAANTWQGSLLFLLGGETCLLPPARRANFPPNVVPSSASMKRSNKSKSCIFQVLLSCDLHSRYNNT